MREIILYVGTFVITYLFYLIFVISRKKVLKKFPNGKELSYLKLKYKIKITDKNLKGIANTVCLANSFILATVVYIICLFKEFIMQILVSIPITIVLILAIYHLIGTHYSRKQGEKNV